MFVAFGKYINRIITQVPTWLYTSNASVGYITKIQIHYEKFTDYKLLSSVSNGFCRQSEILQWAIYPGSNCSYVFCLCISIDRQGQINTATSLQLLSMLHESISDFFFLSRTNMLENYLRTFKIQFVIEGFFLGQIGWKLAKRSTLILNIKI